MYLFFDTETTGLPRSWNAPVEDTDNWPRLVQLAWQLYDAEGNKAEGGDLIIFPDGFVIPIESARVHRITTERARAEGVPLAHAMETFSLLVDRAEHLVAHNMSFDEKIVGAEFLRLGMKDLIAPKKKICTMKASVDFCAIPSPRGGNKWPKLSELHRTLFNEDFAEAHNAAADINATARCFWELGRRGVIPVKAKTGSSDTATRPGEQLGLFS